MDHNLLVHGGILGLFPTDPDLLLTSWGIQVDDFYMFKTSTYILTLKICYVYILYIQQEVQVEKTWDHPKNQPLCLVDWTSRVYIKQLTETNSKTPCKGQTPKRKWNILIFRSYVGFREGISRLYMKATAPLTLSPGIAIVTKGHGNAKYYMYCIVIGGLFLIGQKEKSLLQRVFESWVTIW